MSLKFGLVSFISYILLTSYNRFSKINQRNKKNGSCSYFGILFRPTQQQKREEKEATADGRSQSQDGL